MSKEEKTTFDASTLSQLDIEEKAKEKRQQVKEDIEERKKSQTDTGRKSKEAKEAETEEILVGMLKDVITGFNSIMVKYVGDELHHSEEEIETISYLSAPVITKHVDIDKLKYKEEIALISFLMMAEVPKLDALSRRIAKETKGKKKKENKKTGSEEEKKSEYEYSLAD